MARQTTLEAPILAMLEVAKAQRNKALDNCLMLSAQLAAVQEEAAQKEAALNDRIMEVEAKLAKALKPKGKKGVKKDKVA